MDKGEFYLNGERIYDASNAYNTHSLINDKNIYLFAMNTDGTVTRFSSIKIYYVRIFYEEDLVRDYIPVIDSSNRPCLFDRVEKKCYYNQGEGEFIYPKKINNFKEVEYLESTGTQYINTSVKGTTNLKIDVKYFVNEYNNERNYVFGTATDGGNRVQWFHTSKSFAGFGNEYNSSLQTDNSNSLNTLFLDKGAFYLNGVKVYDKSNTNYNFSNEMSPIALFACYAHGNVERFSSIKIYYVRIYYGENLIRDYIPVIDLSNNPCLYDRVGNQCYYNQGTGEFLYG